MSAQHKMLEQKLINNLGSQLIVGFTGTRKGMTDAQRDAFVLAILELSPELLVHGGAIGADAQAHDLAADLGVPVWIRPAADPRRPKCPHPCSARLTGACEVYELQSPLDRNKEIVEEAHVLIAAPATNDEVRRSGTWATIRYARKIGKPVVMLWPEKRQPDW